MTPPKASPDIPADLRRRAEARLQSRTTGLKKPSSQEARDLLQELQIHQVELEMQNDQLRQTQAELETALTKYTDLYDIAPVAYLTLDERGWVLEANLTASRLLGTERSRLLQQPLASFIRPEDIKQFWAYLVAVVHGHPTPPLELTLLGKGGEEVAVQLDSLLVPDAARHPRVRASLVDITAGKQAGEALRESETKYRLLVSNIPAVVFKASADWTVDFFDDKIKEVTGFSREEFHSRRKKWCDLILPDDLPEVRQVFLRALRAGKSYTREYRIINSAGEVLWIRELGRINCNRDGRIEDVTGVLADITRRKQLEEELAKQAQDLARANDELAENNRTIGILNNLGELLQGCHTLTEAYTVTRQSLGRLFAGDSGALFIFSSSRNLVEAMAVWGEAPPAEQVFAPDECWALRRGQAQVGGEGTGAPPCAHVPSQTVGYLCVPLMSHGEAMGLLHVLPASPDEGVLKRKQQLALTVAGQLGLALANLKMQENLRDMAVRDPLTEMFNRRYLEETLEREFLRATRQGAPIAIIMLDIDHFKRCNDTYGHEAGDVLLRELGAFLQRYCRGSNVACRYGGEEFVLTLPECSLQIACRRAEEMRQAVKTLQVHHGHRTLEAITLSFGVAAFPEHGENPDAVLNAADAAMYRAKQQGRDRVVAADLDSA